MRVTTWRVVVTAVLIAAIFVVIVSMGNYYSDDNPCLTPSSVECWVKRDQSFGYSGLL